MDDGGDGNCGGGSPIYFQREMREETVGGGRCSIQNPKFVLIYSMLVNGTTVGVQINPSLIHDVFKIRHLQTVMYKEISCRV
jgi:hypothetical protein